MHEPSHSRENVVELKSMRGLTAHGNCRRAPGLFTMPRMNTHDLQSTGAPRSPTDAVWRLGLLLAGCLALAGLQPLAGSAQTVVRVAAYNIKHGRGMDDRVDLSRIAAVLRSLDADVITLQEVDDRTERTGGVDQVEVLADLLGYEGVHGPHRPYQGGFYGNAVLTRLPIQRQRTHSIPPASGSALTVHEVEVLLSDERLPSLSVVSVHLAGSDHERMAQADSVTSYFAGRTTPVVLAGDFNGRPGSPVLTRLARDWTIVVKDGPPFTYPSDAPDREIDFVMLRSTDPIEIVSHRVVDEAVASDHRPLIAEIRVR